MYNVALPKMGVILKALRPVVQKITMSLVTEMFKFQTYITQKHYHYFLQKKCEKLLQCKSFLQFFSKNTAAVDVLSTVRLIKSLLFVKRNGALNNWAQKSKFRVDSVHKGGKKKMKIAASAFIHLLLSEYTFL